MIIVAVLVVTCTLMPVFMVGALGVQIREELEFGESRLGLAVALFFLTSALASAFVGRLVERLGASPSLRLACVSTGIGLCGMAFGSPNWTALALWLCVAAIGMALGTPAANLVLARRISVQRMGTAFGVKQASAPAAALLAGLAVPSLGVHLGWRVAVLAGAVLTLLVMIGIPELEDRTEPALRAASSRPPVALRSTRTVLVTLGAAFAMGNISANPIGIFLVEFAVISGFEIGTAGLILATGSVAGIVTRVAVGWMADHRMGGHLRMVGLMLAAGSGGYLLLATGAPRLILLGALLGFTAGWGWNGLFSLAVVQENPAAPAMATGFTHAGGYLGAAAGPLVFGYIAEYVGYETAWGFTAVAGIFGAMMMLVGQRLAQKQAEKV